MLPTMRPTRKIIFDFVGVFLIGGIAGGLVTWSYVNWSNTGAQISSFMNRTNDPDRMVDRMNKKYAEEYHLSPDELNRIQPTIRDMARDIFRVRHKFGIDIMATLDSYHQKIAEQLTPEHRAAYLKAMAERKTELASMLLDQSSPGQEQK